jgi:hypothetical protein
MVMARELIFLLVINECRTIFKKSYLLTVIFFYIQADQNNTVNSSSSGNNRENVQKNLS